jgi:DNA-binding CsgD family transcriptional regulator
MLHGEEPPAREKLTPRERDILSWGAAGKSAWETSVLLGISEATVFTHLDHTRRKLNVTDTTRAVVVAVQPSELNPDAPPKILRWRNASVNAKIAVWLMQHGQT